MTTLMAEVDYAERVLGAQPTERQRAEILTAMTRHGIARDHPALGIIAEMILYREQMEQLLADAAQAAAQCATAGETAAAAAATIAATAGEMAAQMSRAEAAAEARLRQPVTEAETALRQEREAMLAADRARLAEAQRIVATAERRAATAVALSWLPAVVLFAAGLLAGGLGYAWFRPPAAVAVVGCVVQAQGEDAGGRWLRCAR